jgi:hypothetical protein
MWNWSACGLPIKKFKKSAWLALFHCKNIRSVRFWGKVKVMNCQKWAFLIENASELYYIPDPFM